MLGAGMDTRPWRMKCLPADLHWFELDQPDVVAAKQALLKQAAAEVPPPLGEDGGASNPSTPGGAPPGSPMTTALHRHLR